MILWWFVLEEKDGDTVFNFVCAWMKIALEVTGIFCKLGSW
jgi:hypothetical protein